MSTPLEVQALRLWHAASFHRRAPERNQIYADLLMLEASRSEFPQIRSRAIEILKERQQC